MKYVAAGWLALLCHMLAFTGFVVGFSPVLFIGLPALAVLVVAVAVWGSQRPSPSASRGDGNWHLRRLAIGDPRYQR